MLAHQELLRHAEDKNVVARMAKRDQQTRIGATIGPEAVPVRLSPTRSGELIDDGTIPQIVLLLTRRRSRQRLR